MITILEKIKSFVANNKLGVGVALMMLLVGVLTMLMFHTMLGKL